MKRTTKLRPGLKATFTIALVCVGIYGCKYQQGQSNQGPQPGSGDAASNDGMRTAVLTDPTLNNMAAFSMQIPANWAFQGSVHRDIPCDFSDPHGIFQAQSPDGLTGVELTKPFFTFWPNAQLFFGPRGGSLQGCGRVMQPPTADRALAIIASSIRNGAQISQPEIIPNDPAFERNLQNAQNGRLRISGTEAEVHVEYSVNGQPVEELIKAQTTVTQLPGGVYSVTIVLAVHASKGQLGSGDTLFALAKGLTVNPEWAQQSQQYAAMQKQQTDQWGAQVRNGIAARAQEGMARTRTLTAQTIDNIHRTGEASMNSAAASEAARHSSAMGTAASMNGQQHCVSTTSSQSKIDEYCDPGQGWVVAP